LKEERRSCLLIPEKGGYLGMDRPEKTDYRAIWEAALGEGTGKKIFLGGFQGPGADLRLTFYQPGGRFASHLQRTDNGQAGKVIHLKQPHFLS
jgi:hypothetical protein